MESLAHGREGTQPPGISAVFHLTVEFWLFPPFNKDRRPAGSNEAPSSALYGCETLDQPV